tara:strand:- start:15942 stop:17297 length:1356 start_codon:yes stop_codon:yes gene_type:complete
MQGMGIGMIQGAQVSPYNRAPNWATSLAGGFQGAEQYGQAADARALEGAQEDRTTSLRAQIAQILRAEGELTVEDLQEMIALAMEAKDVPLAQNLIRLLQDTQDRASGSTTSAPTYDYEERGTGPEGEAVSLRRDKATGQIERTEDAGQTWLPAGPGYSFAEVPEAEGDEGPDQHDGLWRDPETGNIIEVKVWQEAGSPLSALHPRTGVQITDNLVMGDLIPNAWASADDDRTGTPEMIGKAQMFLTTTGNALDVLNTDLGDYTIGESGLAYLSDRGWPIISDWAYGKLSDKDQTMLGAVGQLAEAWLRLTTGAAYNREEKRDAVNNFLIRPNMGTSRQAQIRRNRANIEKALATMAGGGDPCSVDSSFCPNPNNPMGPDGKHLSNWEASFKKDEVVGDQSLLFQSPSYAPVGGTPALPGPGTLNTGTPAQAPPAFETAAQRRARMLGGNG